MGIGRNDDISSYNDDVPRIMWSSGKVAMKRQGLTRFASGVGFFTERGRDEELDAACEAAEVEQIEVRHGGGNIVTHWYFGENLLFLPVTQGPPAEALYALTRDEKMRQKTASSGLRVYWRNGASNVQVRGFIDPLLRVGYDRIMQLNVKGTISDLFIKALCDHVRVCKAADSIVDRSKHPGAIELYEIALPLEPGMEQEFGKEHRLQLTPVMSGHAAEVDKSYIKKVWAASLYGKVDIEASAMREWDDILEWAARVEVDEEEDGGVQSPVPGSDHITSGVTYRADAPMPPLNRGRNAPQLVTAEDTEDDIPF